MSTDKNDHLPRPDWCFAVCHYYQPVVARFYLVVFFTCFALRHRVRCRLSWVL